MKIDIVLFILFIHWVSDFLCQTDWMAQNKSKNWKALLVHTMVYSTIFMVIGHFYGIFIENIWFGMQFGAITFICHTITDYFTSRLNSKLWKEQKVHWFFVSVGFDQLLHYTQLLLTYQLLQ